VLIWAFNAVVWALVLYRRVARILHARYPEAA
jgi:hypothetical protein